MNICGMAAEDWIVYSIHLLSFFSDVRSAQRSIYDGYKNQHTNQGFPGMTANYKPMSNLMIPRCVAPSIDLITACSCVYRCGFMLIPSGPMFSFEGEKTYATCHQRSTMVCVISIYTISSNLRVFFCHQNCRQLPACICAEKVLSRSMILEPGKVNTYLFFFSERNGEHWKQRTSGSLACNSEEQKA